MLCISLYGQTQEPILVADRHCKAYKKETLRLIYSFKKGDKIIISIKTKKDKKLRSFKVTQNKKVLVNKTNATSIDKMEIIVTESNWVNFNFNGPGTGREFDLKIWRIPSDESGKYFNTALQQYRKYDTTYVNYQIDSVLGYMPPIHQPQSFEVIKDVDYESVKMYEKKMNIKGVSKKSIFLTKPTDTIKRPKKEMVLLGYQILITSAAGAESMWKAISVGVDIGSMFLGPAAGIAAGTAFDMIAPQDGGEPVKFMIMDNKRDLAKFMDSDYNTTPLQYETGLVTGMSATWWPMDTLAIGLENLNIYAEINVSITVFAIYQSTEWHTIKTDMVTIKPKTVKLTKTRQVIENKKWWENQK